MGSIECYVTGRWCDSKGRQDRAEQFKNRFAAMVLLLRRNWCMHSTGSLAAGEAKLDEHVLFQQNIRSRFKPTKRLFACVCRKRVTSKYFAPLSPPMRYQKKYYEGGKFIFQLQKKKTTVEINCRGCNQPCFIHGTMAKRISFITIQ